MEKKFTILLEQDEDGIFLARVPDIEGCYTQGKTVQEAVDRIKEAIEVCLEGDEQDFNPVKFIGIQQIQINSPKFSVQNA